MKLRFIFALLGIGLFLTANVGFASDVNKTTKDCSWDISSNDYDVASYEASIDTNFDFSATSLTSVTDGYVDVGKEIVNFSTLAGSISISNKRATYPNINYWYLYKEYILFTLTYKSNSKSPECLCRYKC